MTGTVRLRAVRVRLRAVIGRCDTYARTASALEQGCADGGGVARGERHVAVKVMTCTMWHLAVGFMAKWP